MDAQLVSAHRTRAGEHEATAVDYGSGPQIREWEIVMRFYAALHLVDAYLAAKTPTVMPQDHQQRWRAIREHRELSEGRGKQLSLAYKRLEQLSKEVRYRPSFSTRQNHIDDARRDLQAVHRFLDGKLAALLPPDDV